MKKKKNDPILYYDAIFINVWPSFCWHPTENLKFKEILDLVSLTVIKIKVGPLIALKYILKIDRILRKKEFSKFNGKSDKGFIFFPTIPHIYNLQLIHKERPCPVAVVTIFLSSQRRRLPFLEAFLVLVELSKLALVKTLVAVASDVVQHFSVHPFPLPFQCRKSHSLIQKVKVL